MWRRGSGNGTVGSTAQVARIPIRSTALYGTGRGYRRSVGARVYAHYAAADSLLGAYYTLRSSILLAECSVYWPRDSSSQGLPIDGGGWAATFRSIRASNCDRGKGL